MQLMSLLMPLISLVGLVAFVWLVVVAFKHSTLWGVLVLLFSPITAIIFAIKCWEEAKKPFLVYIGSSAAAVAVVVIFMVFLGAPMIQMARQMQEGEVSSEQAADFFEEHMDRMEQTGMLSNADKAEMEKMRGMLDEIRTDGKVEEDSGSVPGVLAQTGSPDQTRSGTNVVMEATIHDPATVSTTRIKRSRDVVTLREIDDFVGDRLKVVTHDGAELTGTYKGRSGDDLQFAKRLTSGSMDVWISQADVSSLELLKRSGR